MTEPCVNGIVSSIDLDYFGKEKAGKITSLLLVVMNYRTNQLILTEKGVIIINTLGSTLMENERIRSFYELPSRFRAILQVSPDKKWTLIHRNPHKLLTLSQKERCINFLKRKKILAPAFMEPFPEFTAQISVLPEVSVVIPPENRYQTSLKTKMTPLEYDDNPPTLIGEFDEKNIHNK